VLPERPDPAMYTTVGAARGTSATGAVEVAAEPSVMLESASPT
jgi:hypothetical protein